MKKSLVSIATIVDYYHLPTPPHRINESLDVFLGYSSSCGFHILPKDLVLQRVVNPEPVTMQAWTTCFRLAINRKNKQAKEAIGKEEHLNTTCNVWPCIILLEYEFLMNDFNYSSGRHS
ncbi:hypothetical protein TNCV_3958881 [Trichonephila clavipes]|nr:hypothetical protein TNCV_3958881 [Trichonephila clavipes]